MQLGESRVHLPHLSQCLSESTTKSKLATLNEKLDVLERRLEMLEVQVSTAAANPSLFAK
ncbi:hypothetical protein HID58_036143 [Brassica napus]|uniref:Uncharacterized protein n=1 Tax=Brassica napus TaxID=3708 RepID=A0ABQ8C6W9_BRANA|nr:hypothetical protein HID58_036143 [Brassica napus]